MALTYEEAAQRRDSYNYVYGTVLRGLLQEESVNIQAYLDYVHDIPVEKYLNPDPQLVALLAKILLRKYIFINSYRTILVDAEP